MEKNVCFRALEPKDAELIYKWHNDVDMMKDAIGMERFWTMQECINWVEAKSKKDPFNYWFAICLNNDSKKMIGYFGINQIHFVNGSATSEAIVIGDRENRDGISWIETYLFMMHYIFEVLHLHRLFGFHMDSQKQSSLVADLFCMRIEGKEKECYYKNGKYIDGTRIALLSDEYFYHKANGDYEMSEILKKFRRILRTKKAQ
ncbi:MAG: GNAT family N-acetyltransferase [Odoribacter splanchnicus]